MSDCELCQGAGDIYVDFTKPGDDVIEYFEQGANVVCDCKKG